MTSVDIYERQNLITGHVSNCLARKVVISLIFLESIDNRQIPRVQSLCEVTITENLLTFTRS